MEKRERVLSRIFEKITLFSKKATTLIVVHNSSATFTALKCNFFGTTHLSLKDFQYLHNRITSQSHPTHRTSLLLVHWQTIIGYIGKHDVNSRAVKTTRVQEHCVALTTEVFCSWVPSSIALR